ncbi:MAG TPA: oligosaccharide flippase family protein [Ignavibacteriaceae bacterium]|nr:oligosaccharide flippase family protein [Ignavibacteriaceae bacterium]
MPKKFKEYFSIIWRKGRNSSSELSWFIGGQIIILVLSFLTIKIISRIGTGDYGIYSLIITISSLVTAVYYGPVQQGFTRFFYVYAEKNQGPMFSGMMIRYILFSTIALLIIVLPLALGIKSFLNNYFLLILLIGAFVAFSKSSEFFNASFNILRKRKENSILQSFEKLSVIILLLLLLFSKSLVLINILTGLTLVALIFSFLKYSYFKKSLPVITAVPRSSKKEIFKSLITYSTPFLVWGLSGWLQLNSEKWIMAKILSTSDVGIYSVMVSLVSLFIGIPNTLLNEFSLPIIFQQFTNFNEHEKTENGLNYINILTWLVAALTILSTIITFFFGKYLILFISYKEYIIYYELLPLLTLGTGLFYTAQTMATLGLALNKPKVYLIPKVLIGIISVSLNFIFISKFGVTGAAYTVLSVGIVFFIYINFINRKLISDLRK